MRMSQWTLDGQVDWMRDLGAPHAGHLAFFVKQLVQSSAPHLEHFFVSQPLLRLFLQPAQIPDSGMT